jgi:hypothetical protein
MVSVGCRPVHEPRHAPVLYSRPHVADDDDRTDANDEHLARALSLIVSQKIERSRDRAPALFFVFVCEDL